MAIAVLTQIEGSGLDTYDAITAKLGLDQNPPEGLRVHTAGAGENGYFVYNVWDSPEVWERFRDERLGPAVQEVTGGTVQMPKVTTWELHAFRTL
jgi:hypothetical protein